MTTDTKSPRMASDNPFAEQILAELNCVGARYISVAVYGLRIDYARHHMESVLCPRGVQTWFDDHTGLRLFWTQSRIFG